MRDACGTHGAHLYVLALEESCPWWMDKGFVLEAGANLTARLNIFPDVHRARSALMKSTGATRGEPCLRGAAPARTLLPHELLPHTLLPRTLLPRTLLPCPHGEPHTTRVVCSAAPIHRPGG